MCHSSCLNIYMCAPNGWQLFNHLRAPVTLPRPWRQQESFEPCHLYNGTLLQNQLLHENRNNFFLFNARPPLECCCLCQRICYVPTVGKEDFKGFLLYELILSYDSLESTWEWAGHVQWRSDEHRDKTPESLRNILIHRWPITIWMTVKR